MANRYWVGGAGTWNTTSTTNWSASSGGASGASVPTAADAVFFDQAATYTVTMTGALNCLDITVSAGTVTFAVGTTPTLSVAGNWSTIAGTVWGASIPVTFTATTSKTITSGGITIGSNFTFNGSAGTWTLQDNLTLGSTITTTLTLGTLALGTFTLSTGLFASSGTGVRTLNFGTGKIVLNSATTSTVWTTATVTNLTVSGTPLVECQGGGTAVTKTISTGALSEANSISFSLLETTGTVTYAFTASNVVKNLTINGVQTLSNIAIFIYGSFTHSTANGTTTFTAGANAWTFAATSGTPSLGYISGFTYDFPWTFGSAASTATWTLPSNLTLGATRQLSLANGTTDFNSKTISAAGITIVTGTPTIANTGTASFTTTLPITHTSGTLTLPFNITTSSASGYTFTAGTLALGTYTLTTPVFSSSGSGVRTLNFGTGKIVLNGSATATIWNTATITSMTVSGTPLVECQGGGTGVTKTISAGALSEANSISFSLLETTGTVTYAFTASNTVKNLIINGVQTLSNIAILIYGTYTYSTTNGVTTFTAGANAWTFAATTAGTRNITSGGATYDFPWTFGSATSSAVWQLQDNLTLGATRQLSLTNGTTDFNSKTLSAAGITIVTGTPTIANTGTASFTTTLPITHTSGTLTLPFAVTTSAAAGYTFTAGTLTLNNQILTTTVFTSNGSGTRTLAFGTTGQIALTGNNTTIYNFATATGLTVTGTVYVNCTYTGSTGTRTINWGGTAGATLANSPNVAFSGTTGIVLSPSATDTIDLTGGFGTVNLTSFTGTLSNTTRTIYGSLTIPASGGTYTAGTNATTFAATSAANITTNGVTLDFPITFNGVAGNWTLQGNLTVGSTRTTTLTAGTITLNNLVLSTGVFSSSGSTARVLAFGTTGQLALTGNGVTIFDTTTATNFSNTGTVYINATYTGGTGTRTIVTGFTEAQSASYSVATSGTTGIVLSPSATDTVALTGSFYSIDLTGFTGTLSNTARTLYGNLTTPASGGTYTAGTNATTFAATSGTKTITTNARTLDFPITFAGVGGTFQLVDNLTLGSTRTVTLTNGTIDLNNRTLSALTFSSNNSNARAIAFGTTGIITVSGNNATVWDMNTATNFTYTGTPRIYSTYNGATGTRGFYCGYTAGATASNVIDVSIGSSGTGIVITAGTDTIDLSGGFNNVDLTGLTMTVTCGHDKNIYGNFSIPASGGAYTAGSGLVNFVSTSGTKTVTTNGTSLPCAVTFNGVGGTFQLSGAFNTTSSYSATLTNGTLDLNNFTLTTGFFNSNNSNTRVLAFGTTGKVAIISGGATTALDFGTMTNFSYTGTVKIYSTVSIFGGQRVFSWNANSLAQAINVSIGTSGDGLVITNGNNDDAIQLNGNYNNVDLSNLTTTLGNNNRSVYGNFTVPAAAGGFTAGTSVTTFITTTTQTITTNGRTLDFPITINNTGTTQLAGALTIGSSRAVTLTAGTLDLNNFTLTTGTLSSNNSNTRVIAFGTTGKISVAGNNATLVDFTTMTNITYTGTPKIYSTYTGATGTRTFNFGATAGATATNVLDVSIGTTGNGLVIAAGTDTVDLLGYYGNIDFTGLTMTIANSVKNIIGNLSIPAAGGTFTAGTSAWTFVSPTTQTITTNGRTLDFPITIGNGTSNGVAQLAGALTLGSTRTFTLTSGNFDLNNFTTTANVFAANGTANRILSFSSTGQVTLVGSGGTIISMPTATGFSYSGTPKILSSYAAATGTRTFALGNAAAISLGNNFDFNINGSSGIIIAGGTDTLSVVGSVRDFDLRNSTNILSNDTRTVYGNFYTSGTGGTFTAGANTTTLAGYSGDFTIDSANRVLDFPLAINGNGNYTLTNSYISGSSSTVSTRAFTISTGNLIINDVILRVGSFVSNTSNIRGLNFSGTTGQMNLMNSNTTIWNSNVGTNFSLTGNYIINSTYASNVGTRVFDFGTLSETNAPNVKITTGTAGFNIGTANDSVTLTGAISDLNLTGLLATVTNTARTIYGNLTIPATGGTFTAGTTATTFGGTSGTDTIDTQGRTLQFPLTFNGVGGNWTLANNLVANATTALTLTNGQVDFNQKALTFANITVLTGNAGLSNLSTTLNFVHTSGNLTPLSGTINSSTSGTYTIAAGTLSANAAFTTGAFTLTAGNVTANALLTTGAFTHTAGNMSVLTGGSVNTAAYTQNGGNVIINGGDLTATTFTSNTGTRTIQLTSGNINVTSTGTVVNMANTTALTANGTGNIQITNIGSTAITVTPGAPAAANSINYNFTGGTYALTITAGNIKGANFTGFAGSVVDTAVTMFGNLTLGTGMTITGANAMTFASGTQDQIITSNGITLDRPVTINKAANTVFFSDNANLGTARTFTLTAGTVTNNANLVIGTVTHTAGSFNANGNVTTQAYTLQAGNCNVNAPVSTQAFTQNNGNIILANDLTTTTFTSNTGTTRSIQFGTSNINVTSTGTVVNMANTTALTTTGSGNIQITNAGSTPITVTPGSPAEANTINYNFTGGTYPLTITAGNVESLNFTGYAGTLSDTAIIVYGNLTLATGMTVTGANTITFAGGASNPNKIITTSGVTIDRPVTINRTANTIFFADTANLGTTRTFTLTAGTVTNNANLVVGPVTHTAGSFNANSNVTAQAYTMAAGNCNVNAPVSTQAFTHNGGNIILVGGDLTVTTLSSTNSALRSIQFGTNNVNVTGTGTVVNMTTITNLSTTGTGNINITSAGSTAISVIPGALSEANALNYNFTGGTYALSLTAGSVKNLNFTGYAGTVNDTAMTIYGNLTMSTGMTRTAGAAAWTFASTGTQYITSNGKTLDCPITINGVSGTVVINDAFTSGASRTTTLSNGTLNLNGFTFTAGNFTVGVGTKNITFNAGTLAVAGNGATAFNMVNPTGFTMTKGTGNGTISMTSASVKTFVGANLTYPVALDNAGSANLTVTGNNTFEVIKSSYAQSTANANILLPNDGNTTVTVGVGSGASSTKIFGIMGTTTANRANLIYTGSGNVVTDYIATTQMSYISNTWAETSNGSMPWRWYLGANSTIASDVIGGLLVNNDGNTAPILYFITTGSSFTVPENWNSANNTVHMWGGGGGSAGSKTPAGGGGNIIGSSGGGGGGYTKVVNFAASPNSTVSFSIGSGGTAGVANTSNGGNGGTTTFSTYSANGGGGSTITATGTTSGVGGIGTTYNGGNGGFGAFTVNTSNNSAGGGGGGAGGPNGIGGNGGNASADNGTAATTAGGGGGGAGGGTNGSAGSGATSGAGGIPGGGAGGSSGGAGNSANFGYTIFNSTGEGGGSGGGGANGLGGSVGGNTIGGGAGGSGANELGTTINGVQGGPGGIILVYYACLSPVFSSTSSMFLVF